MLKLRFIAIFATAVTLIHAQEVTIPDPGLNAAIRAALQIPTGPLTQQDMLILTNLDASRRNVRNITGLETASNLASLDLQINLIANLSVPSALKGLKLLDLSVNPLTNVVLPSALSNLTSLRIEGSGLTNLTLPAILPVLTNLDLENNQLAKFDLPSNLTSLVFLDLGFNLLTNYSLPDGLTNLSSFYFAGNPLVSVTLPADLVAMTELNLSQNLLTHFTLPPGMTNLEELDLAFNQLTSVTLPNDLVRLTELDLDFNRLTKLALPANLASLSLLHLRANLFTNFNLATDLPALTYLDVSENFLSGFALSVPLPKLATLRLTGNRLASLILPAGLTNLAALNLGSNLLTSLVLPSDLSHLQTLLLGANPLTHITLPSGLTNLTGLFFTGDQLTNITLPADMTRLLDLGYLGNPLTTVVLPEMLAATNLSATVDALQSQGVSVFTYPEKTRLVRALALPGAFKFGITGPPATYSIEGTTNFTAWNVLATVRNPLGSISFVDVTAQASRQKSYRAVLQVAPTNMVFIPPNTFIMGASSNDLDRSSLEVPQTTVTLTHGFWIGKYEVTQGEYLAVIGDNPSEFPGNLSRPVSSVTWQDATNYCAKLTQRELAAGRIPAGSFFRLPTEAEWECAARAGTTTRLTYGDDLNYTSLANYAWFLNLGNPQLTVHPVGQKIPNPWGLYDMAGNVWEWCQDWYGNLLGGVQIDPAGPASNLDGAKVMRGGAYDYPDSSCRSSSRLFRYLLSSDTGVGFRVVFTSTP